MKVETMNLVEKCPEICPNADVNVDYEYVNVMGGGLVSVHVIVDCEHRTVCKHLVGEKDA